MLRKNKADDYVEPMPRSLFIKIMREFKANGGKYVANEFSERFLLCQGAEACTLNENTILFKKHPSRAAVYEELFHIQQYRDGKINGELENIYLNEIEAKEYLLENANMLKLTKKEILQTEKALIWYKTALEQLKGGLSDDHL